MRMENVPTSTKLAQIFSVLEFVQTYYTLNNPKLVKHFVAKFESDLRYMLFVFTYQVLMLCYGVSVRGDLSSVAEPRYNYSCSKLPFWSNS